MGKYMKLIMKRVEKDGSLPVAYDPYNKEDVNDIIPTIPASYGNLGRIGTTIIFEVSEDE